MTTARPTDLQRVASDAVEVADMLRWAHVNGYTKERRDRDRPTGPRPADTAHTDNIPGPQYDIGIGSHKARTALEAVTPWIRAAELATFTARRCHGTTAIRRHLTRTTTPDGDDLAIACDRISQVCSELTNIGTDDRSNKALKTAARHLDRAWSRLSPVFTDRSDLPDGLGVPNCWNCRIRPRAEGKTGKPTEGGRCTTCARWRRRSADGRQERPRGLDVNDAKAARAARAKRRARGEGWGDESLSLTTVPPVVAATAGTGQPAPPPPGLLLRDAAAQLGVSRQQVRQLIDAGHLDAATHNGRTYIDPGSIPRSHRQARPA